MTGNDLAEAVEGLRVIAVRNDFYMDEGDGKLMLVTSK
jgi:hypothetical protein